MRTALVNNKAGSALLPEGSMVNQMSAWEFADIVKIAEATYKKGDEWRALPQSLAAKGADVENLVSEGRLPYWEDGVKLFAVYRQYFDSVLTNGESVGNSSASSTAAVAPAPNVEAELRTFWEALVRHTESSHLPKEYSRESLCDALAQFAFMVTAHHELVGSIVHHLQSPAAGGFRLRPEAVRMDAKAFVLAAGLINQPNVASDPSIAFSI